MQSSILDFRGISKSFFGTRALRNVSLSLPSGHVLGLVGENGAGKSTLMNVLAGVLQADRGQMLLDGRILAPRDPNEAAATGIAMVHQELNLFANLSIAENLFLTDMPRFRSSLSWIRWRELYRRTRELLDAVQLPLDPATPVELLTPGERQLVEIAKALALGRGLSSSMNRRPHSHNRMPSGSSRSSPGSAATAFRSSISRTTWAMCCDSATRLPCSGTEKSRRLALRSSSRSTG